MFCGKELINIATLIIDVAVWWQEKMGTHSKVVTVHEKYKKNHHAQNLVDGSGDRSEKTRRISPFEGWWAVLCFSVLLWCLAVGGVWG